MSKVLEILGRAITIDTAELIWNWLNTVTFCDCSDKSAQLHQLKTIIDLIAEGKTDTAAEQLRLYLFEYPRCIRGRLAAAAICLHRNHITGAIEELNPVYRRQPSNTMALYALGHCCERLGREPEAVQFYQDCLKFKKYLQLPRQRLAAIYFKNAQLEKTTAEYELLKEEYPDDISTLVTLGYLFVAGAEFPKAIETFNTAILIHPDSFGADDSDIDQLVQAGCLDEAMEQLETSLGQHPQRADLIARRADLFAMLGATTDAIAQYEQALRICPDFLETTIKLGTQYLQADQTHLAARQFNRAAEINDRIVDAYIGLATAQKLAGETSNALTTLSLAAAITANTPLLFAQTATLQFKEGLPPASFSASSAESQPAHLLDNVIKAHTQQILHRPQNPDLYYRLGILMMGVEDMPEAIRAFQRALQINPTYTRARSKLAVCLYEAGRHQLALDQLTAPKCLDKATLQLHYKTALLYCDRIRFASSLINLLNSMQSNFTYADPTVNISIVLQNLGLLDKAAAMWDNLSDTAQHAAKNTHPFSQDQF